MSNWRDVTAEAPELAATVRARFEATGLGLLATLRRDGSPRISGIEPFFGSGAELWLGMMPGSRKSADLRHDPRFALHSATADKELTEGDARIGGRAELVTGESAIEAARAEFREATGYAPDGPFDLWQVDVTEMSMVRTGEGVLVIEWWRVGEGIRRVERT